MGGGGGLRKAKENSNFEAKISYVNTVSGEKLHDFKIIIPARGVRSHPLCVRACDNP